MAIKEVKFSSRTYKISYEILNLDKKDYILILHGWGAKKELMIKAFKNKFNHLKQIYIDLPGFGGSDIFTPLKTKDYAKIVENFIKDFNHKPSFILGHSFGGKVATLLNPENLILLSTAGIVEKKPFLVKLKIKIFKIFKILGFGGLYRLFASKDVEGMSRVMYETLKNVVDEDFREKFSNYNGKSLIFWGQEDRAVSLKSGELIHKIIKKSEFFPLSGDHFFFLLHSNFIAQKIEEMYLKFQKTDALNNEILDDNYEVSEVFEKEQNINDFEQNVISSIDSALCQKPVVLKTEEIKFEASLKDDLETGNKILKEFKSLQDEYIKLPENKYENLDDFSAVGEVFEREDIKEDIKEDILISNKKMEKGDFSFTKSQILNPDDLKFSKIYKRRFKKALEKIK
ncbi:alpha/beta hydrolase [Campylobacter sp. FMV-PI01]|uniref:Alpha/beta hydrolase n=1 Tax=Campylobacter portucalensis TaxID=2608384 RepID=A0A6L5WI52_9BACT|nr:alpha/beta hydrolase [Campylobacter portucalensis]MSN96799.1 alpha/beta hydrolase [Campylobacter portucalensis]